MGGGNCSSRGVTGTVQMRSFGSVRSITPARHIMYTLQVPERRLLQRPPATQEASADFKCLPVQGAPSPLPCVSSKFLRRVEEFPQNSVRSLEVQDDFPKPLKIGKMPAAIFV